MTSDAPSLSHIESQEPSPARSEKDPSGEKMSAITPTGVNRRTAVLFKKSARKTQKPLPGESTTKKREDASDQNAHTDMVSLF